ncbi:MAG TPA: hypothetical protein VGF95_06090 [Solirubrobacteraceae bacterium]|jgi:hypothetical protein
MTGRSELEARGAGDGEERLDRIALAAADGLSRRQLVKLGGAFALAALATRPPTVARAAKALAHQAKTVIRGSCQEQKRKECSPGSPARGEWYPGCPQSVPNGNTSSFNGCGPEAGIDLPILGHGDWIPDTPFDLANFFYACEGHDCCYGTCGNEKAGCDSNFLGSMIKACEQEWPQKSIAESILNTQDYLLCLAVAAVYHHEVSATQTGQEAYNAGQKEVCECCMDCETYASVTGALDAKWWTACPEEDGEYACVSTCGSEANCGACGVTCPDQCGEGSCQKGACQDGKCVYEPGVLSYCTDCQGMEDCYK